MEEIKMSLPDFYRFLKQNNIKEMSLMSDNQALSGTFRSWQVWTNPNIIRLTMDRSSDPFVIRMIRFVLISIRQGLMHADIVCSSVLSGSDTIYHLDLIV